MSRRSAAAAPGGEPRSRPLSLLLITDHLRHLSGYSGYARLIPYLQTRLDTRTIEPPKLMRRSHPKLDRLVRPDGVGWYGWASLGRELSALGALRDRPGSICHYLFGEGAFHYTGRAAQLGVPVRGKLVCTFHQPPSVFARVIGVRTPLEQLDAAIVLCGTQAAYLRDHMPASRIHVQHHFVDASFFRPPAEPTSRNPLELIFVGSWLRDLATLRRALVQLARVEPRARLHVVADGDGGDALGGLANVTVHGRLRDDELLRLYQRVGALVMPLLDATANNALLEGMACGLPVIVSDVGGVREYLPQGGGALIAPGDADELCAAIRELVNQPELAIARGTGNRERALALSLAEGADGLHALYRRLTPAADESR